MRKIQLAAAAVGVAVAVAGCSSAFEPKPHVTAVKDESVISGTASLTHTFVLDKETSFVTCSGTRPNAAFSQSDSAAFSLSFLNFGGGDEGENDEQSQEIELEGRTPAVLMSSELFFRACEFSRNYELTKEEARALFEKTMDTVKTVWSVEAGNTTISVGEKEVKNIGETVTGTAPPTGLTEGGGGRTGAGTTPVTTEPASGSGQSLSSYSDEESCENNGGSWNPDTYSCG